MRIETFWSQPNAAVNGGCNVMRSINRTGFMLLLIMFANRFQFAIAEPLPVDTNSMVWIPGTTFTMGSNAYYRDEGPAHKVRVDGFWIDEHEVTNAQFARFVKQTKYVTVAERPVSAAEFPMASAELLKPGSAVFVQPENITSGNILQWWKYVPGANWRHPTGPGSTIEAKENHPVVHVAFEDAKAYAKWAGRELPTEAQWELAASSQSKKKLQANTWQGKFPVENTKLDGYEGSAPVKSFPPNERGVYDMLGNVWEWTVNWYAPEHIPQATSNPMGPDAANSFSPHEPGVKVRVIKGGSFLCAPNYCMRFRPTARHSQDIGLGSNHIGFRTILKAPGPDNSMMRSDSKPTNG